MTISSSDARRVSRSVGSGYSFVERVAIGGLVDHLMSDLGHRHLLRRLIAKFLDEPVKLGHRVGRFGVDAVDRERVGQHVPQEFAARRGLVEQPLLGRVADAAGGWLMIRSRAGSSCGLSITFKYDRMSRTSLRSKNDMPPISTYGTLARRSSVSNDRGCSLVRQRMAMSRGCARCVVDQRPDVGHDALGLLGFVLALHDGGPRAAGAGRLEHLLVPLAIERDQRVGVLRIAAVER